MQYDRCFERYISEENKFESIQGAEGGRDTKKNLKCNSAKGLWNWRNGTRKNLKKPKKKKILMNFRNIMNKWNNKK